MRTPSPRSPEPAPHELRPYDLFIVAISVLALIALLVNALLVTHAEAAYLLEVADLLFCGIFLFDFARRLITASDRPGYLRRGGWLDLISSIPAVGILRIGRLVRVSQLVRFLRGARAIRTIGQTLGRRRGSSAFISAGLISLTTLLFGSVAILHFERAGGAHPANIQTASDALWWAFVTITTVGYGDLYPVTAAGRATAAVLMVVGVGLFGTMSGLFASWLVHREREEGREVALLREEIRELKAMLERR